MGDRELLGMAAKAAGIEINFGDEGVMWRPTGDKYFIGRWNPLTDDGDALRLAVRLRMTVRLDDPDAAVVGWAGHQDVPFTSDGKGPWFWKEWHADSDSQAATRSAIVRAAAEIGKAMAPSTDGGEG